MAKKTKRTMSGGRITTIQIILFLALCGIFFAIILYNSFSLTKYPTKKKYIQLQQQQQLLSPDEAYTTRYSPTTPENITTTYVNDPSSQTIELPGPKDTQHIIKIIDSRNSPPIYPVNYPNYQPNNTLQKYQQIGVLVSQDSPENKPIILPLFGRKMYSRDRWEYYTASNEYNMWRISVSVNNRDCQDDVGCDEVYNGDYVTVPDYANKVFIAKIYKNSTRIQ
jgi:hypothetical protein